MAVVQSAVVIPVKAFGSAKARLSPAVASTEREALARSMAEAVVRAAGLLPVVVVCDDPDVRAWARSLGAEVRWTPGLGLDGAVEAGVEWVSTEGFDRVIVAHADLPLATDLQPVTGRGTGGVVLVPDRRHDGTNVISLPTGCGFRFAYGPGSFHRHRAEAERLGLDVTVVDDASLAWDVDIPEDLVLPGGQAVTAAMAGRAGLTGRLHHPGPDQS